MQTEDFKEKSYWLTTQDYTPNQGLLGKIDVDVVVIGGGFTGLSTAYHLKKAEPGLKVALLEAQVIGFGASGRNGGFSMTKMGMMHSLTAIRFGREKTAAAHHYAERAVAYTRELIETLGIDCDYEHTGFLWVATAEKFKRRLYKEIELIDRLGLTGIELIESEDLLRRVNSPLYVGGAWWEPESGILNPAKLAWGWKAVIAPMGVTVFENTPVTEIKKENGRIRLETPQGQLQADKVVLAANAWSHFFTQTRFKQAPVWTYIVLTEPIDEQRLEAIGWKDRESIEDFRDLVHYYRLTVDNRLVFGGRDVSLSWGKNMDKDLDESVFAKLKTDVQETFPSLKGIRFTHQWGGPVSATLDLFPALGYVGDKNLVYALGCVGHGVSLTQLNGATLADLALERDTELTRSFFVNRRTVPIPPDPLRRAVLQSIVSFMRWEDRRYDVLK
jgi:glycine/D-amino acid oxidase-like deaminating enzyme